MSWLKDGQPYNIGQQLQEGELEIASVGRNEAGMYQCMVTSDDDAAQDSIQLSIGSFPPMMKQTFQQQTVQPGSSVSFQCVANGTPPPHFTWTLDGQPLPVSDRYLLGQQPMSNGPIEDENNQLIVTMLNISRIRVEDGGNYKV